MSQNSMSRESSKVITRQWHIVRYLLNGQYVSTTEIKMHLEALEIEAELRTIQRDLIMLQGVFPLECRRDSIPHSWRWQRLLDSPIKGLDLSQALTLCLVEAQLQEILPARLLQELQPLFEKARLITGMLPALSRDLPDDHHQFSATSSRPQSNRQTRAGESRTAIDSWLIEARSLMLKVLNFPQKQRQQQAHYALGEMIERLNEVDLADLAVELKRIG